MLPTRSPPLLPPRQASRCGLVTPRPTRSRATAAKSSCARFLPARAELAAAPDIGDHVNAAALEPELAGGHRIIRQHRHLESPIAGQQHRVVGVALEIR